MNLQPQIITEQGARPSKLSMACISPTSALPSRVGLAGCLTGSGAEKYHPAPQPGSGDQRCKGLFLVPVKAPLAPKSPAVVRSAQRSK